MGWSHCRVGISAWDMLLHGHTFVVPNCNPDQSVYDLCATCTHYCPAFGVFFLPCIYFLLRLHLLMAKVISVAINCNQYTDKDQVRTWRLFIKIVLHLWMCLKEKWMHIWEFLQRCTTLVGPDFHVRSVCGGIFLFCWSMLLLRVWIWLWSTGPETNCCHLLLL